MLSAKSSGAVLGGSATWFMGIEYTRAPISHEQFHGTREQIGWALLTSGSPEYVPQNWRRSNSYVTEPEPVNSQKSPTLVLPRKEQKKKRQNGTELLAGQRHGAPKEPATSMRMISWGCGLACGVDNT